MLQLALNALHLAGSVLLLLAGVRLFIAGIKISGSFIIVGIAVSAIFSNIHQFVAISWPAGEGMPFWCQASLGIGQSGFVLVGFGVLNFANQFINNKLQPTANAASE